MMFALFQKIHFSKESVSSVHNCEIITGKLKVPSLGNISRQVFPIKNCFIPIQSVIQGNLGTKKYEGEKSMSDTPIPNISVLFNNITGYTDEVN